jgi:hypothetical protein
MLAVTFAEAGDEKTARKFLKKERPKKETKRVKPRLRQRR